MLVGVISDTHGRLSRAALDAFAGVDHIVHAGDIGGPDIMWELEALAPVSAVLGNNDYDVPGYALPIMATLTLGGVRILVAHEIRPLLRAVDPAAEGFGVVVTGHSHLPRIEHANGVLFLNPGSPTRSRGEGHTVAILEIVNGEPDARIVRL